MQVRKRLGIGDDIYRNVFKYRVYLRILHAITLIVIRIFLNEFHFIEAVPESYPYKVLYREVVGDDSIENRG